MYLDWRASRSGSELLHAAAAPTDAVPVLCAGSSASAFRRTPPGSTTAWMQLRGTTTMESTEGRFVLHRGGWIMLGRQSQPVLQADRHGICIGICLSADTLHALGTGATPLYPGVGHMLPADLQMAIRLWRRLGLERASGTPHAVDTRPLLLLMADLQRGIADRAHACPGHSPARKRQVLAKLQEACLFMHGNTDRAIRAGELAQRVGLPARYFSEAFLAAYGQSPQSFGTRVRLAHAAGRLRRGEITLDEVAVAVGFKHAGTFVRAFRAHLGQRPGHPEARRGPPSTAGAEAPFRLHAVRRQPPGD